MGHQIEQEAKPPRLASLDALRGFDMFWIIGGSGLLIALLEVLRLPHDWILEVKAQLRHVKWEGFHFLDLVFPLFVFMSGVTIPYSILSKKEKGVAPRRLQLKIVKRAVLLIIIGLSFSVFRFNPSAVRFYTVLWLIGMSYLIGASLSLHVESWQKKVFTIIGVLLAYHLVMLYLPFPGKESGITPENNLAAWMDRSLISTNLYRKVYDPEGSIRVITAGMLCLLGALTGQRIKSYPNAKLRCGLELFGAGLGFLFFGWIWSFFFPIIKDLWSPSFILWTAGWSLLLLSIFYTVIDVWKQKWMGWFFIPIGMNSITIYVGQHYVNFGDIQHYFFGGLANICSDADLKKLVLAFGLIAIKWGFLYWLFIKKLFLRV
ncbi:acyltransferase family protein [Pontiella sulfatireligans]|uniref:Uncharacterized protein n=1 Tax=Pontiella sulfatireligans TaxID=2750658 RepID=A0A6C2UN74_9BACT|nr:DUF5009 domain-containing protein [Pontiella sulfatireligans]VGO20797.1 hypothetical protein SCARR_02864 [Pontiella sulfatireligans]